MQAKTDKIDINTFVQKFKPKICAFAFNIDQDTPKVCQMGFVVYHNKIILHTNTWTQKWKAIYDGQKVALCIGFNHLEDYIQIQGAVKKIFITEPEFEEFESVYFREHTDAVNYKKNNQEGIIVITPSKLRYARVEGHAVTFNDYSLD